jgi:aconitate hydratase
MLTAYSEKTRYANLQINIKKREKLMLPIGHDQLGAQKTLTLNGQTYHYFSLREVEKSIPSAQQLPFSLKILLENLLRYENGRTITVEDIKALAEWTKNRTAERELAFHPARVLMQDFTGVPAVVDLAAMRQAIIDLGGKPEKINPLVPVDLVIDHSVIVDQYASKEAFSYNVTKEYERNKERYSFLRWGQQNFSNFRVVPPGTGICHQVNLEYLAQVIWKAPYNEKVYLYPDTLVGTDSHTPMVNGLSVLGWGVGGIEAEAVMLGQPLSMMIPEVIGVKLIGKLREGSTATDLVLTITQMLRNYGVVNKFVEFYGEGLSSMSLPDRATVANMTPEFGATCSFFPTDHETLRYLEFTGRDTNHIKLIEVYAKEQGLWRDDSAPDPLFTHTLELNLETVEPTLAGPKRPQDKTLLSQVKTSFKAVLDSEKAPSLRTITVAPKGKRPFNLENGHVVIAAITSCTNTSNPSVMLGAGLLARNAFDKGLSVQPWVKTSLAPGSQVVTDYLIKAGLQSALDEMGFNLVGYGCTTCIGNSGPLLPEIAHAIEDNDLTVVSVLSGNRNFEGRIHPQVKCSYLASPLLVVAYALAGTVNIDLTKDPLGTSVKGEPVYLKDIWPSNEDISYATARHVAPDMFRKRYADVFKGEQRWNSLTNKKSALIYEWDSKSTYVKLPPFFENLSKTPEKLQDINKARPLALLGDSITTDHISPAGSIQYDSPAGKYLTTHHISTSDFNSYGARRGNHEVMIRGTFSNIRLKNEMVPTIQGGFTKHYPSGETLSIYEAAQRYEQEQIPLIIIAGREYGTGSSRDWAAKGVRLLGVKAVIAESFERIHRSNLVGMGVLPLQFPQGINRHSLKLTGQEQFDLLGFGNKPKPLMEVTGLIHRPDGTQDSISLQARIDTADELDYFLNGGILPYVLRKLIAKAA